MNRKLKNVIMIVLLGVLLLANGFTVYKARSYKEEKYKETINRPYPMDEARESGEGKASEKETFKEERLDGPYDMDKQNREFVGGQNSNKLPKYYYAIFISENMAISLIVVYLILSDFNKKNIKETFVNSDKVIILIMSSIILTIGITFADYYLAGNIKIAGFKPNDASAEKDTKKEDISKGDEVSDKNINLNNYKNNITITKAGTYNITGSLNASVLIDADGDVTLNLENVQIETSLTAALANISENDLTINLKGENSLIDGGSSEYDAALYSAGNLFLKGEGKLNVYGRQTEGEGIATEGKNITIDGGNIYIESNDDGINAGGDGGTITINDGAIFIKASGDGIDSNKNLIINGGTIYTMGSSFGGDAGIDTDEGFVINGGNVIALGSDMLESPLKNSSQKTLCFTLNEKISKDSLVTLLNEEDEIIISFIAKEDFKTLIISNGVLEKGKYSLYVGDKNSGDLDNNIYGTGKYEKGEKVIISERDLFEINANVTLVK